MSYEESSSLRNLKVNRIVLLNINLLTKNTSYEEFKSLQNKDQISDDLIFLARNLTKIIKEIFKDIESKINILLGYIIKDLHNKLMMLSNDNKNLSDIIKDLETYL
jgi:hypothetical protein